MMDGQFQYEEIKYGLEFETLLYDPNSLIYSGLGYDCYKDILDHFSLGETKIEDNIEDLSAEVNYAIADLYDNYCLDKSTNPPIPKDFCKIGSYIHNSYFFSYTMEYHGRSRLPFEYSEYCLSKKAPTWTVTLDSSVKLKTEEEKFLTVRNYDTLDNYDKSDTFLKTLDAFTTLLGGNTNDFNYLKSNVIDFDYYCRNQSCKLSSTSGKLFQYVEFTSPILRSHIHGKDYIQQILDMMKLDNQLKLIHNSTTSQHVHLSYKDELRKPENLLKVCQAWLYFEYVFMNLLPWWRKENDYCNTMHKLKLENPSIGIDLLKCTVDDIINIDSKRFNSLRYRFVCNSDDPSKISKSGEYCTVEELEQLLKDPLIRIIMCFQGNPKRHSARYAAVNLMNLLPGKIGTLEIRIKHGSNDAEEIAMFVELFSRFLIAALKCEDISKTIETLNPSIDDETYENDFDITQLEDLFSFIETGLTESENIDHLTDYFTVIYWSLIRDLNKDDTPRATKKQRVNSVSSQTGGKQLSTLLPVFSYGSNHSRQLQHRIHSQQPPKPHQACLPNHIRIFAGYSRHWRGSVATIYPCQGKTVEGTLYYLTPQQISKLDKFEIGYKKMFKYVSLGKQQKRVKAIVYVKKEHSCCNYLPSKKYLEAIKTTLKEGHPKTPQNHLEIWSIPSKGNKPVHTITVLI